MIEAKRFANGCVASPHYLASAAGVEVLASGGNALDAAIATNLALGVVAPYMCGYGGDLFALIWDGQLHAYNGSGRAPAAATVEAVREAAGSDEMPVHGPLTVTVPGAVEGWFTLLERFGTRDFEALAQRALSYAADGFPLTERAARYMYYRPPEADWRKEWVSVYSRARPHARFDQPDLARTISTLCSRGPDAYYRGEIAEAIAATLQEHGALMTTDDLAAHTGDWVEPISGTYRGVGVVQMPPNSQGVTALEALAILDGFEPGGPDDVDRHHRMLEATKLALADRDAYLTDPDHMLIEAAELASPEWAGMRRAEIDPGRAGTPEPGRAATGGTIYLCAADADGMCVSLIESNYMGFGSGVTVPGWGINLQNRGAYFSLDPAHVNVTAPRKRTMHTLMPAMAFRDGEPWLVFGTMGGDGQAQTHVQFLTHVIDDGADIGAAIDAPRWAITPSDWSVAMESRFRGDLAIELNRLGHAIEEVGPYETVMGHAHAIEVTPDGYAAAFDPRSEGAALGL